jgi:hypothetical protein
MTNTEEQKSPLTEAELLAQKPIKELIELEAIINPADIKENSVVLFKIKEVTQGLLMALAQLQQRYGNQLRMKNITLMILGADDKIETVDEEQMAKAGWEKKEKSRIITLS